MPATISPPGVSTGSIARRLHPPHRVAELLRHREDVREHVPGVERVDAGTVKRAHTLAPAATLVPAATSRRAAI